VSDFDEAADKILEIAKPGDIVITMGGGDIYKVAKMLTK
jgi:UDP-N-acetylmuramate-alanine ligase